MIRSDRASLRIVIPAFNEEGRIGPTLRDYCAVFADTAQVVVVANGCRDRTAAVVRELKAEYANLSLIDIPNAIGKGGAVRVGLATGAEPFVGFVDADGSTEAREFERLFQKLRESPADAVVGSRWLPESNVVPHQPMRRRFASRTFNAIVRALFGIPLRDTQCGAKLFRREAVREILTSLEVADFAFDIEVLWLLKRSGRAIEEVATSWADRAAGTKIDLFSSSWQMLASVLRLRMRYTLLWGIPFVDYFARKNVIPVRGGRRILLLGARDAGHDEDLQRLVSVLRTAGVEILDERQAGDAVSPASFVFWYVFRSRRNYDAIIELAGEKLWIVPWLSVKPAFIVETRDSSHRVRRAHHRWYGRSTFVDLAQEEPETAKDLILTMAYVGAVHPTIFFSGGEALTLHYSDCQTGEPTSRILR